MYAIEEKLVWSETEDCWHNLVTKPEARDALFQILDQYGLDCCDE